MSLAQTITVIIGAFGVTVAAFSALKALAEYRKQGITKRSEIFLQMRSRLREDDSFKYICNLLEGDDERLRDVSLVEKDRFIGFFEELALLRNSGFINDHVTLYMFGYFAVRCFKSENFWYRLNRDQPLWTLFMDFAKQMQEAERTFQYERRYFHL